MSVVFPLPKMKKFEGMKFIALASDTNVNGILLQYSDEDRKQYDIEIPIDEAEKISHMLKIAFQAKR